ncbi:hypothetical protein ACHAXS_013474 [Conticribra weissflogii]
MSTKNTLDIGGSVSSEEASIYETSTVSSYPEDDTMNGSTKKSKSRRGMTGMKSKVFSSMRKLNNNNGSINTLGTLSRNSSRYDSSSTNSDDNDNYADLFDTVDEFMGEIDLHHSHSHDPSSSPHRLSNISSITGDAAPPAPSAEERARREARKEKVKEKLNQYKTERTQLKHSCRALEQQLMQTTKKLKEVDLKAAKKIDSLESELNETRNMMEAMVNKSGKEVTDQTMCIKTLGKKLIRQAHVIKQQKKAVEEYEIQLEALREEMAMQEERDSIMEEEYVALRNDYDSLRKQKEATQRSLQEHIEEMMDLKQERDKAAARIRELETTLEQKELALRRVKRESKEKSERISTLENELGAKTKEVETISLQLKASEQAVDVMKSELERTTDEIEELRSKVADLDIASSARSRRSTFLGWRSIRNNEDDEFGDSLEDQIAQRDLKIQALDQTVKTNEETITSLKSDMVKMSSSYKQDDYLKRKQIAKLKHINGEYAKRLKALEASFKQINADVSMHGSSVHSVKAMSKEERAVEMKKRLGEGSEGSLEFSKGEMPEEC